jgi:hypothetical protein
MPFSSCRHLALAAMTFALLSCGGAASLVLKSPIADKCHDAGLRGCDDLADGVIAYATGDKETGLHKIEKGVAQNAPDQLQEFAAKVRLLKDIPGAQQYAGPLIEVADLLAPSGSTRGAMSRAATSSGTTASMSTGSDGPASRSRSLAGSIVVGADTIAHKCLALQDESFVPESASALCLPLAQGPLEVTDAHVVGPCPNALLLGAGEMSSPTWFLLVPPQGVLAAHGAELPVRAGEALFAVQFADASGAQAASGRCAITWAAHGQ